MDEKPKQIDFAALTPDWGKITHVGTAGYLWKVTDEGDLDPIYPTWEVACTEPEWEVFV